MATPKTDFPPVRACLFDMDGLLINTEDIYTLCHNILLATYSAGPMTWSIKSKLQGRPAHEAISLLLNWANIPNISPAEYTQKLHIIQAEQFPNAAPLPGVEKLLRDLKATQKGDRKIYVALATSSHEGHFTIKTQHLGEMFEVFEQDRRVLGDDPRIPKGRGKPSPDIYLVALQAINQGLPEGEEKIRPEECLVFEDGIPGVIAGRRAGMRVVWVPHPGLAQEYLGKEAKILAGLGEDESPDLEQIGTVGDGWAEQLESLEEFPYEKYGIVTF
ncbi:GS1 protein [Microdochium trichocladiopsis]|uniref:GS1 protein n=1 Tax=Microdochium trichocladiopsis TaxID=1682393 RepID=A0A9P8XRV7_9PEZI|nr:GS1 protein [Microdochium trichocladiopsis]KAH7007888.1 GS1 protein [Microdochium trichocladiopsis]